LKGKILGSEEPENFFKAIGTLGSKCTWPVPRDIRRAAWDLTEDDQILFSDYYDRVEMFLVLFWHALSTEDFCKIEESGEITWTTNESEDDCLKVVHKILLDLEVVKTKTLVKTKEASIYKNVFK